MVKNSNILSISKFSTTTIIFTLEYIIRSVSIVTWDIYIVEEKDFKSKGSNY